MSQSSINRRLTQICSTLLGISIAIWVLRGFEILTFIPGGVIWLLFLAAVSLGIITFIQKTWWRI
jgi:hypothetical protein